LGVEVASGPSKNEVLSAQPRSTIQIQRPTDTPTPCSTTLTRTPRQRYKTPDDPPLSHSSLTTALAQCRLCVVLLLGLHGEVNKLAHEHHCSLNWFALRCRGVLGEPQNTISSFWVSRCPRKQRPDPESDLESGMVWGAETLDPVNDSAMRQFRSFHARYFNHHISSTDRSSSCCPIK